jgi:hypothetical protein
VTRQETHSEGLCVEWFKPALVPAEAQGFFTCLGDRQVPPSGTFFEENQPDLNLRFVIHLQTTT